MDYSGEWLDTSTFEVTIVDVGQGVVPVETDMRATITGRVRNPSRTIKRTSLPGGSTSEPLDHTGKPLGTSGA